MREIINAGDLRVAFHGDENNEIVFYVIKAPILGRTRDGLAVIVSGSGEYGPGCVVMFAVHSAMGRAKLIA